MRSEMKAALRLERENSRADFGPEWAEFGPKS